MPAIASCPRPRRKTPCRRVVAWAAAWIAATSAWAAPASFDIAAQSLETALQQVSRQAGVKVVAPSTLVAGRQAPAVRGMLEPAEALRLLLAGSGLVAVSDADGWTVRAGSEQTLSTVQVIGKAEPAEAPYAGGQVARGGRVGVLGDQDVFETPFNVTNFTAQAIADTQSTRVADLVKRDPAVRVASSQTSFYADYSIRGFRVTGSAITFDGLSGMIPEYAPSLLPAIERVEVIKGANTLLTNSASGLSLGGTINLVPKRAGNRPVTQATLGFESDSRFSQHVDIGRRFGPDDAFGARVTLYRSSGDAAFDNEHERLTLAALSLDWRSDRARATLDLGDTRQRTRASLGSLYLDPALGIGVPRTPKSASNFVQPFSFSETHPRFAVARAEVDLLKNVTAYAAYGWADNRYKQLLPFGLLKNGAGDIDEIYQNGTGSDSNRGLDTGLRARFETGFLTHQLSLSFARTRFGNDGFYVFDEAGGTQPTIASNIYRPVRVQQRADIFYRDRDDLEPNNRNDSRSYAIADTVSGFDDRLFVTAGWRRQLQKGNSFSPDDGTPFPGYNVNAWSPGFGALFKLTSVFSIYANRIKALEGAPSPPDTAVNRTDVFPPTQNQQTEAGVKADFGKLGITLDVFRIVRPSGIVDPATNIFSIDGKQRNTGVELAVFGEPLTGVRLLAGVSTIEAKLIKTQDGTFDGKRVTAVPKRTASLSGEWDLPWLAGSTVTAGATHTGPAFIDQDNTLRIASHTEFELGARYATRLLDRALTLRATVSNVLDRRYWVADVYGSFYQGAPRSVSLAASIDF